MFPPLYLIYISTDLVILKIIHIDKQKDLRGWISFSSMIPSFPSLKASIASPPSLPTFLPVHQPTYIYLTPIFSFPLYPWPGYLLPMETVAYFHDVSCRGGPSYTVGIPQGPAKGTHFSHLSFTTLFPFPPTLLSYIFSAPFSHSHLLSFPQYSAAIIFI